MGAGSLRGLHAAAGWAPNSEDDHFLHGRCGPEARLRRTARGDPRAWRAHARAPDRRVVLDEPHRAIDGPVPDADARLVRFLARYTEIATFAPVTTRNTAKMRRSVVPLSRCASFAPRGATNMLGIAMARNAGT